MNIVKCKINGCVKAKVFRNVSKLLFNGKIIGILVVYAIDNYSSFSDVQKYKEKIDRVKENEPYALVLVGNKCDLEATREVDIDCP